MKKLLRLFVPAIVAIALFASCEDKMDEIVVQEEVKVENTDKTAMLPDKDKLKRPRY